MVAWVQGMFAGICGDGVSENGMVCMEGIEQL